MDIDSITFDTGMEKPKVDLDFKEVDGDMDSVTRVALVPRGHEVDIFDILKTLGCDFENRYKNAPKRRTQYRGSGTTSYRRGDTGSLFVHVDVGCWHEHDCCGCLCNLSFEIQLTDFNYVIIKSEGYNY